MRDLRLEQEVASGDDAACEVYADWLDQQQQPVMAAGYRLLSGVAGVLPELDRWAGAFAVASAVWLLPWPGDSAWLETRDMMLAAVHRARLALETRARDVDGDLETDRVVVPGIEASSWQTVHRAIARLHDYARDPDDRAALVDAVRSARLSVDRAMFHRLFGCVLRNAVATGVSPFSTSPALAASIAAITERELTVDLPLAGERGSIAFEDVLVSNSTSGVHLAWHQRDHAISSVAALPALAGQDEFLQAASFNEMTPGQRLEWWQNEFLSGDEVEWEPLRHYDMLSDLFENAARNEGKPMLLDGTATHVVDVLERFGVFTGGAKTSEKFDFPIFFLELEDTWLFCRITY